MADDPIDNFVIFDKGDDFHLYAALRAGERINFINFADHLGPSLGRAISWLFFND